MLFLASLVGAREIIGFELYSSESYSVEDIKQALIHRKYISLANNDTIVLDYRIRKIIDTCCNPVSVLCYNSGNNNSDKSKAFYYFAKTMVVSISSNSYQQEGLIITPMNSIPIVLESLLDHFYMKDFLLKSINDSTGDCGKSQIVLNEQELERLFTELEDEKQEGSETILLREGFDEGIACDARKAFRNNRKNQSVTLVRYQKLVNTIIGQLVIMTGNQYVWYVNQGEDIENKTYQFGILGSSDLVKWLKAMLLQAKAGCALSMEVQGDG